MEVSFEVYRGGPDLRISKHIVARTLASHEVFIRTTHSGVCGTDEVYLKSGQVLGHEGVGVIKALGSGVTEFKVGDRVGFGFARSICSNCDNCSIGWDQYCRNGERYGTADRDNGTFSSGGVWDVNCIYPIPKGYPSAHAAPLFCAGATVWTILSEMGVKSTDRVGIMGIGGLGHLAIKLAAAMGCQVVVFSSSESKKQEALEYGASEFHVTKSSEPVDVRPVKHLLLCGSSSIDYEELVPLVDTLGSIYPLTIALKPASIPILGLVRKGVKIQGTLVGSRKCIQSLLEFAARKDIKPTIMEYPMSIEGVDTAMQHLREGKVKYRAVLVCEGANL